MEEEARKESFSRTRSQNGIWPRAFARLGGRAHAVPRTHVRGYFLKAHYTHSRVRGYFPGAKRAETDSEQTVTCGNCFLVTPTSADGGRCGARCVFTDDLGVGYFSASCAASLLATS